MNKCAILGFAFSLCATTALAAEPFQCGHKGGDFTYGLTAGESELYLTLPPGKKLELFGTIPTLVDGAKGP